MLVGKGHGNRDIDVLISVDEITGTRFCAHRWKLGLESLRRDDGLDTQFTVAGEIFAA